MTEPRQVFADAAAASGRRIAARFRQFIPGSEARGTSHVEGTWAKHGGKSQPAVLVGAPLPAHLLSLWMGGWNRTLGALRVAEPFVPERRTDLAVRYRPVGDHPFEHEASFPAPSRARRF